MHVDHCKSVQKGKEYTSILLRHTYRKENKKVAHKTILNLTNFPKEEVFAIEWALKNKKEIPSLIKEKIERKLGKQYAGVYLVNEIAKKLSIDKALGKTEEGRKALFLLVSMVVNHGSFLSSIRMASYQATAEVTQIGEPLNEDDIYKHLGWISLNQKSIEKKLFKLRYGERTPEVFLYDVTSSYFEGQQNELGAYGYGRDGKKGKKQVIVGLMCDECGNPIAIRLFRGNTLDFKTVQEQIKQLANDFGCKRVTFVGDRGMIKQRQIEELSSEDFYYITAITKPQIETLLKESVIQMSYFDNDIREVVHEGIRYILRRNPARAEQLQKMRDEKEAVIVKLCRTKNEYLSEHKRAKPETAINEIEKRIKKLKTDKWLKIDKDSENERRLILISDKGQKSSEAQLDGCYVIKSNVPEEVDKKIIHDRYKDLMFVEQDFRRMKTDWLEIRPWYVRRESSTRGRAFLVMLARLIIKNLEDAWKGENITVEEGLKILNGLCLNEIKLNGELNRWELPEPSDMMKRLLELAGVILPKNIPVVRTNVYTRVKLKRKT